jgi:hypothetical protein
MLEELDQELAARQQRLVRNIVIAVVVAEQFAAAAYIFLFLL